MNTWRSCRDLGIVNDMKECAEYAGKLIQVQAAWMLAKITVEYEARTLERAIIVARTLHRRGVLTKLCRTAGRM